MAPRGVGRLLTLEQMLGMEGRGVLDSNRGPAPAVEPIPGSRERILAGALERFAEGGPRTLTMRALGAQVGLHNSSLFHHFPAKRDLVRAIRAHVDANLRRHLHALALDDPPRLESLVRVLRDLSDHYARVPIEARCALRLLLEPSLAGDSSTSALTPLYGWLARAQASGAIRPVSVGHAARTLLGMILMVGSWPGSAPSERDDRRRQGELAAFVRGALRPAT